ncbi:hypothetical protein SAMN05428970_2013 [Agromyces sp. CF514]|nr:hypothetical protein SAMN05428970_2013 [Agromyces sp. CF514]
MVIAISGYRLSLRIDAESPVQTPFTACLVHLSERHVFEIRSRQLRETLRHLRTLIRGTIETALIRSKMRFACQQVVDRSEQRVRIDIAVIRHFKIVKIDVQERIGHVRELPLRLELELRGKDPLVSRSQRVILRPLTLLLRSMLSLTALKLRSQFSSPSLSSLRTIIRSLALRLHRVESLLPRITKSISTLNRRLTISRGLNNFSVDRVDDFFRHGIAPSWLVAALRGLSREEREVKRTGG